MNSELERLIKAFMDRLVNRSRPFYTQFANGTGYESIDAVLTVDLILEHVQGFITISLPPFDDQGNCKWCVWDSDHEGGNLYRVESTLRKLGLIPLLEARRPGREGHLWLFFDAKIPAAILRRFAEFVMQITELDLQYNVEFFPKQDKQNSQDKCPNGVRMPLGINRKAEANGAVGWFDGCATRDKITQLAWFAEQPLNPASGIMNLVQKLKEQDDREFKVIKYSRGKNPPATEAFADLNPKKVGRDYYICDCPNCGERRAFFYAAGNWLNCNRIDNCGFRVSTGHYLKQKKKATSIRGSGQQCDLDH